MNGVVARIAGVSHQYGAARALDDISLALPAGQMVGLIGPDGVGKSTLLALIAGVRRIQTGEVLVLDGDMRQAEHRTAFAARIAYMPQGLGSNLYPTLSVFENLDIRARRERMSVIVATAYMEEAERFDAEGIEGIED